MIPEYGYVGEMKLRNKEDFIVKIKRPQAGAGQKSLEGQPHSCGEN